ncbi:predicted protein [Postia placenta Mad-698-R]|uniref:Xylanolytic transcriptional activator regulatory domain-containing protein n=1 Tax=Postia placenta MAD-698-R-SB12 TaxID=670580 RepID=A0A1X6N6U4_9APHY|nr:hypothetical protein POSPLADRAFT_1054944 [Postia placenta MAD-698-R-SB12]EED78405.1 predicted protein [Postia placenta Mad-698-R]OSX64331.1 hypothetical protein POSPLADRAFT_1054944 [Postia placenta MAD-698-R-SB12]
MGAECGYLDELDCDNIQALERHIAHLENHIANLEDPSLAPVTLHDPYEQFHRMQGPHQGSVQRHRLSELSLRALACIEFRLLPFMRTFILPGQALQTDHSAALLNAIYLVGAHCSNDPQMHGLQAELLTLTLEHLAVGLNNPTPTAIMHALQTEVLLASYFFSNNCALEGTYRANAAADMALACRLHVIGSLCGPTSDVLPISIPYRLAVPANVVEMGECINAFWTVYALDKAWSFALGYASAFTDDERKGTEIDVPWPLTVHDNMPASLRTVKVFVYGASPAHAQESWLALHAKAISLMEHATRTASLISGGEHLPYHSDQSRDL